MANTKKLLAALIAVLMIAASVPFTASAAVPAVQVINGVNTVFVSAFGRVSYEGSPQTAFKTFGEAFAALGKDGGKIIFSGTLDMTGFEDVEGRGSIIVEGVGTKLSGSVLSFPEDLAAIELAGDLYIDNAVIKTAENTVIHTNGYIFETGERFDSYYNEKYNMTTLKNTVSYPAPIVISAGSYSSDISASEVRISAGNIGAVVGGSDTDSIVSGTTKFVVSGGTVENLYAGNYLSTGSFEGTSDITVSGGTVNKLILGSDGGTTKANFVVTLEGGKIENLYLGAESGSSVEGNVVLVHNGGFIESFVTSNASAVKGKKILISGNSEFEENSSVFDYIIKAEETSVKPVFNGTDLAGFKILDKNGFIPSRVFVNGNEVSGADGVYQIPSGKSAITCESSATIRVNKNASYVAGYEDGTFAPQNNITRAEAITLLSRIICEDISTLPAIVTTEYKDIQKSDWYYGTVGFFEGLGYLEKLEKDGGTVIDPKSNITRAEFAEIAFHVLSEIYDGREFGIKIFSDVNSLNKYFDSVGQLGYLGIIGGYEDGTFGPDRPITRAEVVTIVNRMLGRIPTGQTEGAVSFPDAEGHWAKPQIITACNPATVGTTAVWTLKDDITVGSFELLEGDVTVGDQIKNLYEKAESLSSLDTITGIDMVSKWQIEKIVNSPDMPDNEGNTTYYVSPNGNDENDGKSPETAWKTLSKLGDAKVIFKLKAGDTIRFERGGEWRGNLVCRNGVNYGAYGTGPKPVINASKKDYADPSLWTETEVPGVWKCTDLLENVGIIVYDYTGILGNYHEKVGFLQVEGVNGFTGYKDLKEDLTFASDLDTDELYVCSLEGNPGERFKSIEIGTCFNMCTVQNPGNVIIDNISFRFTGAHGVGIGDKENVTVQNCTFDYLGGSILRGFNGGNLVRYGNALQVYGGCDGWYLYNNWMYQIYDTGVTHQYAYSGEGNCHMDNVKYIGNVIEYCHWSIEYYNPERDGTKRSFRNTYIADNICRLNGYGWGSQIRMSSATLFQSAGIPKDTVNFVAENNIFDRSSARIYNCNSVGDLKLELRNNIYVQKSGNKFASFQNMVFDADEYTMNSMRRHAKDTTSIFLLNNDTTINDYYVYPKQ